jgi:hypothetical protein
MGVSSRHEIESFLDMLSKATLPACGTSMAQLIIEEYSTPNIDSSSSGKIKSPPTEERLVISADCCGGAFFRTVATLKIQPGKKAKAKAVCGQVEPLEDRRRKMWSNQEYNLLRTQSLLDYSRK